MQVTRAVASHQSSVISEEHPLYARFVASLQPLIVPTLATPIAVALSGGADSLALTLLAYAWATAHGGSVIALTVDHRLRDESTAEAAHVASMMHARGIAHHILTPPHGEHSNNLQENARIRRYDALAEWCRAHGINHCLLGHHLDDQLETVALAHLRGRATLNLEEERSEGEAGMRAQRSYREVVFLRPLLDVPKQVLVDYLRADGAEWVNDPSNANPRFARVRMREQLASNPALRAELLATLAKRTAAREAREAALAEAYPRCIHHPEDGTRLLHLTAWGELDSALQSLLLANVIRELGGKLHRPRRHETERLADALRHEPVGKRTLGHCLIVWNSRQTATITREKQVP